MNHAAEMIERSKPELRTFIGRREVMEDEISLTTVRRIAKVPRTRCSIWNPPGSSRDRSCRRTGFRCASATTRLSAISAPTGPPTRACSCPMISCSEAALPHLPGRLTGFAARLMRPLRVGDPPKGCGAAARGGPMACRGVDEEDYDCAAVELECAA